MTEEEIFNLPGIPKTDLSAELKADELSRSLAVSLLKRTRTKLIDQSHVARKNVTIDDAVFKEFTENMDIACQQMTSVATLRLLATVASFATSYETTFWTHMAILSQPDINAAKRYLLEKLNGVPLSPQTLAATIAVAEKMWSHTRSEYKLPE